MPLYIERSGDLVWCHGSLTHWLTHWQTLKDRATQLLIKWSSRNAMKNIIWGQDQRGKHSGWYGCRIYIYIWKVIAVFYFYGICRNYFIWSILDIWPTLWVVSFENNYFENDQNVQFLAERAVHGKTARERFFRLSGVETSSSFRPVVTVNS